MFTEEFNVFSPPTESVIISDLEESHRPSFLKDDGDGPHAAVT